jgi:hypothetical protein
MYTKGKYYFEWLQVWIWVPLLPVLLLSTTNQSAVVSPNKSDQKVLSVSS